MLGAHPDIYPLIVAIQACEPALGCNRELAIRRLTQSDPANAYGWSLAFESAARKNDHAAMRIALARMAGSSHFENYTARIRRDLFESAGKLASGDADFVAGLVEGAERASYLMFGDVRHSARWNCSAPRQGDFAPRWIEAAPEIRPDCLRVAQLLASSADVVSARWGWRQIYLQTDDVDLRERALQNLRNAWWLTEQAWGSPGATRLPGGGRREWTATDWASWSSAWALGDGEIPALKRWLASQGQPVEAPADYQMPQL